MELERFIIIAFAAFRIAELFTVDDGPFDCFLKLRTWAGVYDLDKSGQIKSGLGRLMDCPYCLGAWIALALTLFVLWPPNERTWIYVLAIAGAQAFLQTMGGRK